MAKGVEIRGKRLRIFFRWQGQLCRETLDLAPTEENRAYAERMVAQIRYEIQAGTFDYAR